MAMQHKAFSCAPQSILASATAINPHINGYQVQLPRPAKRTRKTGHHQTTTIPPLSASASTWGATNVHEQDPESSSESDDGESSGIASNQLEGHEPAKKRRHLGLEDVDRFASMTIDRSDVFTSSPNISPQGQSSQLKEVLPTSVIEPESDDDDDTAMQARRGPTIHQLDSNRFYVSSLSDDSSDEEGEMTKSKQDEIDTVLDSGPIEVQQDGNLIVNGVLINQLQALEAHRRQSLHRERSSMQRRGPNSPDDGNHRKDRGALILWAEPEYPFLGCRGTDFRQSAPARTALNTGPIVLEEGGYAYVHRPSQCTIPSQDDTMDIDD